MYDCLKNSHPYLHTCPHTPDLEMLQHQKGISHLLCLPIDQSKKCTSIGMILDEFKAYNLLMKHILCSNSPKSSSVQIKGMKASINTF